MDDDSFEVTPSLAFDFAQAVFSELFDVLDKKGVIELGAMSDRLAAAGADAEADGKRDVSIALKGLAEGMAQASKDRSAK